LERLASGPKNINVQPTDRQLQDLRTLLAAYVKALTESKSAPDVVLLEKLISESRAKIEELEQKSAADRARVSVAEAVLSRFESFANEITATPKEGGYPPLMRAATRERLHRDARKHTHVLFVGIDTSGGDMISRETYFGNSRHAVIVVGAQVSYLLLEVAGNKTVAAGTKTLLKDLNYDLKHGDTAVLESSDATKESTNGQASQHGVFERLWKRFTPMHI
jgi:hypothetical protein